jgi:acyl-CoA synthetase (NDP forming)
VAQRLVDAIGAGMTEAACPTVYINQVMQPITGYTRTIMAQAGVPYVIPGLRQAVVALRNVAWWSSVTGDATGSAPATAPVTGVPDAALRRGQWSENAARRLLLDAGVPVVPARLVTSGDDAVKAAAEFGGPVCLKVVSPQILHKTDIGGVRLDVPADEDAVLAAFTGITTAAARVDGASVEGVLVSPMRKGGTELLVGVVRDPHWGRCSRWRSAACSSRCSRIQRSHRCRSRLARRVPCSTSSAAAPCSTASVALLPPTATR